MVQGCRDAMPLVRSRTGAGGSCVYPDLHFWVLRTDTIGICKGTKDRLWVFAPLLCVYWDLEAAKKISLKDVEVSLAGFKSRKRVGDEIFLSSKMT